MLSWIDPKSIRDNIYKKTYLLQQESLNTKEEVQLFDQPSYY